MQIQISWLLQKPTDLDLHCLLRQGMSCSAREGLRLIRVCRCTDWLESSLGAYVRGYVQPWMKKVKDAVCMLWVVHSCIIVSFFFFFIHGLMKWKNIKGNSYMIQHEDKQSCVTRCILFLQVNKSWAARVLFTTYYLIFILLQTNITTILPQYLPSVTRLPLDYGKCSKLTMFNCVKS